MNIVKILFFTAGFMCLHAFVGMAGEENMFTADHSWKNADVSDDNTVNSGTALDLSALVEAPSGKYGRVIVSPEGNMCFANKPDMEIRFHGSNQGINWQFRNLDHAAQKNYFKNLAQNLRKQGYNFLRINLTYNYVCADTENGNLFNADNLDAADYLLSECKNNGLYIDLMLSYGYPKPSHLWDARYDQKIKMFIGDDEVRNRWKNVNINLLSHVNKYTGLSWKDEPIIALLECYNEQETGFGFTNLRLMSDGVKTILTERWQDFLSKHYDSDIIKMNAEFKTNYTSFSSAEIPNDCNQEKRYGGLWVKFQQQLMHENLRWYHNTLCEAGYTGLFSAYNYSRKISVSSVRAWGCPVITKNTYLSHPTEFFRPGSKCYQVSATEYPEGNLSIGTRIIGRPFVLTEYNFPFWNQYQYEQGIAVSAYSALQGISGISIHNNAVKPVSPPKGIQPFDVHNSPVTRASEFLVSCLYMRGDISKSKHIVALEVPTANFSKVEDFSGAISKSQSSIALLCGFGISFPQILDSLEHVNLHPDIKFNLVGESDINEQEYFSDIISNEKQDFNLSAFVNDMRTNKILRDNNATDVENGIYQSDTEEITLRKNDKMITVVTPYSEALSLLPDKKMSLNCLSSISTTVPATIGIVSVDGNSNLANAQKMIFVYSTAVFNTDMKLSNDKTTLINPGSVPILMRTGIVKAELNLDPSHEYVVYALNLCGERRDKILMQKINDKFVLDIDTSSLVHGSTPFFEIISKPQE